MQAGPGGKTSQRLDAEATARFVDQHASIFVSVLRRQNKLVVHTSDDDALDQIRNMIAKLDVPTAQVLMDVKVLSIDLGNDFSSVFGYTASSQAAKTKDTVSGAFNSPLSPLLSGTSSPNPMNFAVVDKYFTAQIQMLDTKTRVTKLATPILMIANNEVSRVFVGEEYPINVGFSSGGTVSTSTSTSTQNAGTQVQFVPVGITLLITPSINADRSVTLRILQQNSTITKGGATVQIPATTGGFVAQSVDIVQAQTVSGTFVAQDQMTVAIGGLIQESIQNNSSGIPFLEDIPFIGAIFRSDEKVRTRTEQIIIIRPYVMNTPAEAESVSRDLLKEISIHPVAATLQNSLDTYRTNDVPRPSNTRPLSTP